VIRRKQNDRHGEADENGGETDKSGVPQDVSGNLSEPTIEILESGALRVWVRTTVTYRDDASTIVFTRDYQLVAGEPLLRMRSSGAAPMLDAGGYHGSSVVVAFPLAAGAGGIETVARGTPYHWTDVMPEIYWDSFTFLPTHGFAIPYAGGSPLCALYHADVPGWGLSNTWNTTTNSFDPNDGVLYGCLWRNGDGNYFSSWVTDSGTPLADGTDPDTHAREYALRMPSSLTAPESGRPLREALAYASPLRGLPAARWGTELPDSLSLASSSDPRAFVTAVKQGSVSPSDVGDTPPMESGRRETRGRGPLAPLSVEVVVTPPLACAVAPLDRRAVLAMDAAV
jgi:alpha-mannosidase